MSKILLRNYLLQNIRIYRIDNRGGELRIPELENIKAGSQIYVDSENFQPGVNLRIYTLLPLALYKNICVPDAGTFLNGKVCNCDIKIVAGIKTGCNCTTYPISEFNIGMVTSKRVPNFISHVIAPNATSGRDSVRIHNLSDQHLYLTQGYIEGCGSGDPFDKRKKNTGLISLPPGGVTEFSGWTRLGAQLGTVLKDVNGRYPDFVWDIPSTDIYYGVVSPTNFPKFSGSQYSFEFVDAIEPDYLWEQGLMGKLNYTTNKLGWLKYGYKQW